MAITETKNTYEDGRWSPDNTQTSLEHVGGVVMVRVQDERRNHSDTLDYSDWRVTSCTSALVYLSRVAPVGSWDKARYQRRTEAQPLAVQDRFDWVDCTNLFTWRGSDHRTATVDADLNDADLSEDLRAWVAGHLLLAMVAWARRCEQAAQLRAERAQAELDRPVVGKRMVVKGGRKVPVGTIGTVAYVGDGRVLLKDDACWRDRKANGTWVAPQHLKAR